MSAYIEFTKFTEFTRKAFLYTPARGADNYEITRLLL
jgi:hypothetical protein